MRMIGHIMGARAMVSTRRSVIFRAEGLELVLTFWGRASRVWSAQNPAANAPPAPFRNDRRPLVLPVMDFMAGYYHNSLANMVLTYASDTAPLTRPRTWAAGGHFAAS